MANRESLVALDVGEKRIGVAIADSSICIAVAHDTIVVDGTEIQQIRDIIARERARIVVVGYPRNQSGETTKQTEYVEQFAARLKPLAPVIEFQDESLSSVRAEELLKLQKKSYQRGDIDALAASLILQDYLEARYGRI